MFFNIRCKSPPWLCKSRNIIKPQSTSYLTLWCGWSLFLALMELCNWELRRIRKRCYISERWGNFWYCGHNSLQSFTWMWVKTCFKTLVNPLFDTTWLVANKVVGNMVIVHWEALIRNLFGQSGLLAESELRPNRVEWPLPFTI